MPSPLYTPAYWNACALHLAGAMSHGLFLLYPLFVHSLGGDAFTVGLSLGLGLAASVALRPLVGLLLDRHGPRSVLLGFGLANALSYLPFLWLDDAGGLLYALAAFHLVAAGALFACYFTLITRLVPASRRVEGIAVFGVAGIAPNGLGPWLGEVVIAELGYPGLFLLATFFALVSLALSARLPPEPRHASTDPGTITLGVRRVLVAAGLVPLLVATALFGADMYAAFFFVTPFVRTLGIARAAPFFMAYAGTTILIRVLGRRRLGQIGTHRILVPAFATLAAGLAAVTLLPLPGLLVLSGVACGAGHGSLFPVLNALSVSRTPPRHHGTVVSLYTGALDLGGVIGNPIWGAVVRVAGYRPMFGLAALVALGGLGIMVRDHRHHGRPAAARAVLSDPFRSS